MRDYAALKNRIRQWTEELGFQAMGVSEARFKGSQEHYFEWLSRGYQGQMAYLENHLDLRFNPQQLVPGTQRIISVRMNYLPPTIPSTDTLLEPDIAYIARYALGRDYHKLIRKRLAKLAGRIETETGPFLHRALTDSAPVLERPLGQQAGIGWTGKNTLLIDRKIGSYFFLGELFVDLPLPPDQAYTRDHCGRCEACLTTCPTDAFVGPYLLDARRCISYLTIEHKGSIAEDLRPLMGNRIFGCDDCQIVCPFNRRPVMSKENDFSPRHQLESSRLVELFRWTEDQFLMNTRGSAIRRTGHEGWLRNIAIALGNAPTSPGVLDALHAAKEHHSPLVREHVAWALEQHPKSKPIEAPPIFELIAKSR